jgi:hypothetical protein
MRKKIILVVYLALVASFAFTQTKNKDISLSLGFGGLISGDQDINGRVVIDFGVINSRIGISIRNKHLFGYRNFYLQETSTKNVSENFRMNGLFYQYSFFRRSIVKFWFEGGYYIGNYCPCGNYDTVKRPKTGILLPGIGAELKIFRAFYLEISFRHGFYLPTINDAPIGDFGLLANIGIVYNLRLR